MPLKTEKVGLSELREGDIVQLTGFTCVNENDVRSVRITANGDPYIYCKHGTHHLAGQAWNEFHDKNETVPEGFRLDTLVGAERVLVEPVDLVPADAQLNKGF